MREVGPVEDLEVPALAVRQRCADEVADAVHRANRRLLERRRKVGAGQVRDMVLHALACGELLRRKREHLRERVRDCVSPAPQIADRLQA